jgi:arylsulfatase A-like enzyme
MPLIVRWPGHAPAGRVDTQTVLAAVDLLPTLCAVTGATLPSGYTPDGEDMSAALQGRPVKDRHKPLFWEYGRNEEFFKYPANATFRSPNVAMRDGPWKLLVSAHGSGAELYDVAADAEERNNLAAARPELVTAMRKQAMNWRKSVP